MQTYCADNKKKIGEASINSDFRNRLSAHSLELLKKGKHSREDWEQNSVLQNGWLFKSHSD